MEPVYASFDGSPMPTKRTLRGRNNLFFQLIRFAAINLKMLRVIGKGSSH